MKNSKLQYLFIGIILFIILGGVLYGRLLRSVTPWDNYLHKETTAFSVLETQDLNTLPQKFRLNVQSHGIVSEVPQKIFLVKKGTDTVYKELALFESMYTNECATHSDTDMMGMDQMEKWDTDWFSVPEGTMFDGAYEPKLLQMYDIKLIYDDQTATDIVSTNLISGVCYQVSESTSISPNPKEDTLPEE